MYEEFVLIYKFSTKIYENENMNGTSNRDLQLETYAIKNDFYEC
jgi:hypothetical protein